MKMTWLHIEFVFITGPSWGKLGRTSAKRLLTLALLACYKQLQYINSKNKIWAVFYLPVIKVIKKFSPLIEWSFAPKYGKVK